MEGLIFILVIAILIIVVRQGSKIGKLNSKIDALLKQQKPFGASFEAKPEKNPTPSPTEKREVIVTPKPEVSTGYFEAKPTVVEHKKEPEIVQPIEPKPAVPIVKEPIHQASPKVVQPPKPSFMERNPDLEKFIGENLLSKIGIVIFVIGMGFLVKLGIDNEVITESMRVGIGVLIGGGMIALAHYLRKSFTAFSSVLIGGALAVLYFTIALAFHEYAIIPQTAAFIIMVLITVFGVLLSVAYDNKVLAILAILGGFGTPFFLSTGEGNVAVLFTYILILDVGMLALVYFKKWNIINKLAYAFTYLIYIGAYFSKYLGSEEELRLTFFLFLTAYYLIFFLMNVVYNVANKRQFKAAEIILLLSNSAMYFGFGLSLVSDYKDGIFNGLFTALVAIFNFVFAFTLYKRKGIDKNLMFLLIGLVLTFVSLVAPIQLEGNYITLFWAVEAVLLLWLANKSQLTIIRRTSILVTILMVISLAIDWQQNYTPIGEYIVLNIVFNKVFITSIFGLFSLWGTSKLLLHDEKLTIGVVFISWKRNFYQVGLIAILYLSILFELNYQLVRAEYVDAFRLVLLGIYNYLFVIGLMQLYRFKPQKELALVVNLSAGITIAAYLTFFLIQVNALRELLPDSSAFYWHYLLLGLFIFIVAKLAKSQLTYFGLQSDYAKIIWGIVAFIGVYTLSIEIGHLSVIYQSGSELSSAEAYSVALKSVYPVVWAISALILMITGMKYRIKTLRIASLVLFSITIIKLFFYDLAGNSTGKTISFILLGVILLLISFLYQKLKFIIQDDDHEKKI